MLWKKCSLWLFFWRINCSQQRRSRAEGSWVYLHCFHHYNHDHGCLPHAGFCFPPQQGHTFLTRCVSFLRRWHLFLRGRAFSGCSREWKNSFGLIMGIIRFTCCVSHVVRSGDPKWQRWLRQLMELAQLPSNPPDLTQQQCGVLAVPEDYSISVNPCC